jgi:hypothetical protein
VGRGLPPGERPETRSPTSQLPSPPSGEDSDSDTGCFPLRRTRTRSKEKKRKKPGSIGAQGERSEGNESSESICSEHPYETPKLMQKSPMINAQPPTVDRNTKPDSVRTERSLEEDGYEPVGRDPGNMESWIAEKTNQFNAVVVSDADTRNIDRNWENKSIFTKNIGVQGSVSEANLNLLQRNFSNKSIKSDSSSKSKDSKDNKRKQKEDQKILKELEKKEKSAQKKPKYQNKKKTTTNFFEITTILPQTIFTINALP